MKTKAFAIITVVALSLAVSLIAQQQSSKERQQPESAAGDPAVTAKLEQIVVLREKVFKNYELLLSAGRAADASGAIELAEARIDLARERGQREEVLKEMMGLVAVHEQHLKGLQSLAADRVATDEVDRARASLLEAEVRLLRARR